MQKETLLFQEADDTLMAAVDEAIDNAVKTAGDEIEKVASPTSPHDYFADGVLRYLFLCLCGADPENGMGVDPEMVWKILYLGRSVARRWEKQRGAAAL